MLRPELPVGTPSKALLTHRMANLFRFCDEALSAGALQADQDRAS
jgi:hypothetical protein